MNTTIDIVFSATYYLELQNVIFVYYWCTFSQVSVNVL